MRYSSGRSWATHRGHGQLMRTNIYGTDSARAEQVEITELIASNIDTVHVSQKKEISAKETHRIVQPCPV